jgi:DNA-binding CsgD family transcriptional regulator
MPRRARTAPLPWKPLLGYAAALAAGAFLLDWLDYQRLARARSADIYVFLVAAAFLGLGVFAGARLFGIRTPKPFDGNPAAQASLGISPAELRVLHALADGLSNKEIGARLHISPHTVKTHVARLCEKLEARRRTEAIARARSLGILS